MLSPLIVYIQHYTAGSRQNNQARKRNKSHPNWKERSKTYFIFRLHDYLNRKSDGIYQKINWIFYLSKDNWKLILKTILFITKTKY